MLLVDSLSISLDDIWCRVGAMTMCRRVIASRLRCNRRGARRSIRWSFLDEDVSKRTQRRCQEHKKTRDRTHGSRGRTGGGSCCVTNAYRSWMTRARRGWMRGRRTTCLLEGDRSSAAEHRQTARCARRRRSEVASRGRARADLATARDGQHGRLSRTCAGLRAAHGAPAAAGRARSRDATCDERRARERRVAVLRGARARARRDAGDGARVGGARRPDEPAPDRRGGFRARPWRPARRSCRSCLATHGSRSA